ncbi:hypothetical protein NVP1084O_058 [Vibrio phage 1.084.O._10N.261.49.F5]|nr:hypothetical protein NVP1084O_058 [Vibrio phage 1.084.O._10N.261.49.F5]
MKTHISHKIPMIENVHVDKQELIDAIRWAQEKAKNTSESVVMTWAGNYDVLVHPAGTFSFISNEVPLYKLEGEYLLPAYN